MEGDVKGGLQGETASTLPHSARFEPMPDTTPTHTTQRSTQTVQPDNDESDSNDSDAKENNRREELRRVREEKQAEPKP